MRGDFQFVQLYQLDRMEERVFHALTFQSDLAVADEMHQRAPGQGSGAFPLLLGGAKPRFHQTVQTLFFQSGHGNDRQTDLLLQFPLVDLIAVFLHDVDHVQGDDDGNVDLHKLSGKIKVSFQIGRVDDVDDAVRLFVQNIIPGDDLFRRVGR